MIKIPYNKGNACTRTSLILMNGIENNSVLANPCKSLFETTIAYEKVAVDLTVNLAKNEPG
jgi:hypothetical protein